MADELPREWEGADLRIVGVVDDLPAVSARGVRFALEVEALQTAGARVPQRLSLAWYPAARGEDDGETEVAPPIVHAGERWQFTVRLKRPHGNVNPGGFDLEAWLLQQNLRATGSVQDREANMRLDAFAGRWSDHVQRARERVRDRIVSALGDAPYAGIIVALAIGDQRAISEAQWTVFNRTGIAHLVSISGLHVTVFAAFAGGLAFALARRSVRLTARMPARRIAALPTMTALLIKESVNQTVDNMGFTNALAACFTMHQLNHSHWAELHDDGWPAAREEDGIPNWKEAPPVVLAEPRTVRADQ